MTIQANPVAATKGSTPFTQDCMAGSDKKIEIGSSNVKAVRPIYLAIVVIALAACSTARDSLSSPDIDAPTDHGMEQEALDQGITGATVPPMRFLLGTTTLEGPSYGTRGDAADDLASAIEADGLASGSVNSNSNSPSLSHPVEKSVLATIAAPVTLLAAPSAALSPAPASVASEPPAGRTPVEAVDRPLAEPAPPPVKLAQADLPSALVVPAATPEARERSFDTTSTLPTPLPPLAALTGSERQATPVADQTPKSVARQVAANDEVIRPHSPPAAQDAAPLRQSVQKQVVAATQAWARAWRAKDENAYLAAYASSFRPQGNLNLADWERRRRQVLAASRNIDLQLDSLSTEIESDKEALVTFHQFYRSDSYQDAVVKQLQLVLVDGRWLIAEERVLETLKTGAQPGGS
ncbi:MAG: hypothetical protein ABI478_09485 [Propionivibrio sp.]